MNKNEFKTMIDHGGKTYKIRMEDVSIIKMVSDTDHIYIFKNGKEISFKIDKAEVFKYIS